VAQGEEGEQPRCEAAAIDDMDEMPKTMAELLDELRALRQRNAALEAAAAERQRTAEALRESEERFRVLFEHSPDAIFVLDPHHPDGMWPILDCNESGARMNGYTRQELIGQPIGLLDVGPEEPEGDLRFLERIRQEGTVWSETLHRRKDGSIFPVEFSIRFITLNGQELLLGIDRDITERRRAEETRMMLERELVETQQRMELETVLRQNEVLRQVDHLKSEFIANISHELRTPLNHIKGYASVLLQRYRDMDEQTAQEFLQTILDAGDHLNRLISDLLDTSKIETGALNLHAEPVRLNRLARDVIQRWRTTSAHQFKLDAPPEMPPILADSGRIRQVLDNLLANVVKHTPPTTTATVELARTPDEQIVTVRDNGQGVPPEHLSRIFDRFYQAEPRTTGRRGSGLGLFICKAIVEQHGGRMWVESTPGAGTEFRFTLPEHDRREEV